MQDLNNKVKEIMTDHYMSAKLASEQGKKVAWCTGIAPSEFLRAMDFVTVFPENHAAMAGARKLGQQLAEIAEAIGYSINICSYARIDFGNIQSGQGPVGWLPKPDLVVCCNNTCVTVIKWYENLAHHFGVPMVLIDIPFNHGDEIEQYTISYIKEQFKEFIQVIEKICHRRFNYDRFIEVVANANKTSQIWSEILAMTNRESLPFTAFEAFSYMSPMVIARGSDETVAFYQYMKDCLKNSEATPSKNQKYKYRLLWDGIPLWYKLREVSEFFKARGAAVVCSTYTHAWILPMDANDPLESMARAYSKVIINVSLESRKQTLLSLVDEYKLDGIIHHNNRSCKPLVLGLYHIGQEFSNKYGIPSIIIDGDQCDPRSFSMAQFVTRMEAFLETIGEGGSEDGG
jgi:benzoyl-CoA reductase/2-hydroxyglutaryl-CoA dehydratase subunit BcrC/BadD/HgdB